jgi:hypothetical protein
MLGEGLGGEGAVAVVAHPSTSRVTAFYGLHASLSNTLKMLS